MALEIYLDLFSQPCRSVYIFAKKNNIPFEFKQVSLMEGEQYGEEFKKINMISKVPAIQDGDFCMGESVAILMYLAEKYQTADHWYPMNLQKRACVNEYLSWHHTGLRPPGSKVFWLRVMIPHIVGVEVPKDRVAWILEDLEGALTVLEEKFIKDTPFIAGEEISLADLVAIVEIMQPVAAGLDVFEGRPKLSAWRDRVKMEVGKDLFDEAHKGIFEIQEMVKKMDPSRMQKFKPKIMKMFF
ncbi:hypothetical protein DPEC_G00320430 [Dallia pectoralis]|uniref:Uncharacterized protein n=1 Tax=Dallia pectoralis TaxID=75939 RepID=A0ACC2FA23_DALPE|nr:hypothetical protein DPEC_G00320430 [Dallia pectoralis]